MKYVESNSKTQKSKTNSSRYSLLTFIIFFVHVFFNYFGFNYPKTLITVSNMFCLLCVKAEWLSSLRDML